MRRFLVPFILLATNAFATPAIAADAGHVATAVAPAECTSSNATGGDIRVITCTLGAGKPHRFTARFSGGHDDTSATLAAELDGQATGCDPDSKMRLFGEDGNVSLHCRIHAGGDPAVAHVLVVTVLWSHAQYVDFAFGAD